MQLGSASIDVNLNEMRQKQIGRESKNKKVDFLIEKREYENVGDIQKRKIDETITSQRNTGVPDNVNNVDNFNISRLGNTNIF